MSIKVGDRVLYNGHTVRLMGVHPIRLKLSHFGTVDGTIRDLILMESTVLPLLNAGDLVFINNIPQGEKDAYPHHWTSIYEDMIKSETPHKIDAIGDSKYFGFVVKINDIWFLPYHLEPVQGYDIV